MRLRSLIVVFIFACCQLTWGKDFIWYNGKQAITYNTTGDSSPVVSVALDMFANDLKQVTGSLPQTASAATATIRIIQLDANGVSEAEKLRLKKSGVPVEQIAEKKDAFFVAVLGSSSNKQVYIVGNNGRGAAYGILELSRLAGVSPWVWWGDVTPEKKNLLTLPAKYKTFQSPSVEYRGIFLNDEDWSLQPWSWMHFEPSDIPGRIGSRTYKEIFKLLLRLRANTIWPGMHGMTPPFYFVPGAKEAADSCGIVIGTSHCEPLMRNNVGEWDVEKYGEYNYITNRSTVQNYWIERLREAGKYENIYTIGMRGIHDSGMEGVKTLQEKTEALQQVIDDQRGFLAKYVNPDVTQIPQQFVPYKEVLQIMENGLQLPDDITLTWCDDNYGYLTRLSDASQQKRSGGAGVYYHLQYWGRPHDYMWLSTTQPGLIYNEMKQAYDTNARRLWIVNVHDMKTAAYDMELFLDMAWDINSVSPSTINAHQKNWLCREFGQEAGEKLLPVMLEFYRLCGIRKPEFMGWNQVELDKNKYARGWSPVIDSEFSLTEFGGELDRYLEDYEAIKKTVAEVEKIIMPERKDAFFSHIKYPVFAAAAMSTKMLEAQRARSIAAANYNPARWTRDEELLKACAKSMNAYFEIQRLTNYYNHEMAGGKWEYSMCYNPRDLYVFYAPNLPVGLTDEEIKKYVSLDNVKSDALQIAANDSCIAVNACQYTQAMEGVAPIQSLGHSMHAVSLPKGQSITFEFHSPWEGEAVLRTAVIPTQPNDTGDIRLSVSIDNETPQVCSFKEPFRSEQWKKNVLRGQAVLVTPHSIRKGAHTLTITALDEHIVIDQWMLDFKPDRKFYVFPLESAFK
ncbi:glycosyl hydrolase 115 family protein [Parabacteroides sp. OttesenSCG-928-B22]|nr:glycosyl hydrolase 115 family protein [Parabacteroides sp. OttesenSCG-928-B22]